MIRIKSLQEGFRRAGVSHSKEATDYPNDTFSAKQLKELQAEPMLAVEIIADKKEDKKQPA